MKSGHERRTRHRYPVSVRTISYKQEPGAGERCLDLFVAILLGLDGDETQAAQPLGSQAEGLTLFDGRVIAWDLLQAGRYMITAEPLDQWDVVFARVSTGEQVLEGCSLKQQIEYAFTRAVKAESRITAVYVDPGKSATRLTFDKREGIRHLLEDVRRRKVRTIYVYKRDRIARSAIEWSMFLKTCAAHSTQIVFTCPEEPPIGQGAYGHFAEMIIIAAAELEASITRVRVLDSITNRFNNGQWIGGALPYGLCKDEVGRIVPHPTEAPVVWEIYRLAQEELLGDMRIADRINQTYPASRRGADWNRVQVMRVLTNRTYCGYFTLELEVEKDGRRTTERMERRSEHLPILVSEETWQQVAAMRASRTHKGYGGPSRHRASPNLLLGLLRCGECGGLMRSRHMVQRYRRQDGSVRESHTRYYFCRNGMDVRGCSYRGHAPQEPIDQAVVTALVDHLSLVPTATVIARAKALMKARVANVRVSLSAVDKELRQTEAALRRNQSYFERVTDPRQVDYYQARIQELIRQRSLQLERQAELQERLLEGAQLGHNEDSISQLLEKWPDLFGQCPTVRQRAMMTDAVERVVWHPDAKCLDLVFRFKVDRMGEPDRILYAE